MSDNRLHGIDTPERDQPYGKQATRNLDKLIGRTVFVVERDTDRYGRLVGTLYTPEGVNVNLEMVCKGSAWWYSRYAKNNRAMASCQREAKEAGLGLWADDDPMPPWEWRGRRSRLTTSDMPATPYLPRHRAVLL